MSRELAKDRILKKMTKIFPGTSKDKYFKNVLNKKTTSY